MGNADATFFLDDVDGVDLAALGPALEYHPIFPERANIGIAEIGDRRSIRLRVWERGAGITPACGTGACAALVAAHRRGLTRRPAHAQLRGGSRERALPEEGHALSSQSPDPGFGRVVDAPLPHASPASFLP